MPNRFYNNVRELIPLTRARGVVIDDDFDSITAAFAAVEEELDALAAAGVGANNGVLELENASASILKFYNTGAIANQKRYRIYTDTDGVIHFSAFDDAETGSEDFISVSRISGAVDTILFDNGNVDIDENLTVDGLITGNAGIYLVGATNDLYQRHPSAAANAKMWRSQVNSSGSWKLFTRTDADGAGEDAITVSRSGAEITTVLFDNGNVDIDENLNVDGSLTVGGLVYFESGNPGLIFTETDQSSGYKSWGIRSVSSQFAIQAMSDGGGSGTENAILISRVSGAIATILFDNGNVDIDEDLNVDGTVTMPQFFASQAEVITGTETGKVVSPDTLSGRMSVSGVTDYPNRSTTIQRISSYTEDSWTDIGTTGATHVWAPMSAVPSDIHWVDVLIRMQATSAGQTANTIYTQEVYARKYGSSAGIDDLTFLCSNGLRTDASGNGYSEQCTVRRIPVSGRRFEVYWTSEPSNATIDLILIGYGYNGG